MAAIAVVYGEEMTEQTHTGNTNFVDALKIAAASWTANAVYMLLVTAQVNGNSSNGVFEFRTVHGTTPTVFVGATHILEPAQTTNQKLNYVYVTKYTVPATAEDVIFQIKTQSSGNTVQADSIVISAIRLDADLTEDVDWFFVEDNNDIQHTTTFVDFAKKTFTPGNNNDDWLVIANVFWSVDNLVINAQARIRLDGTEASPTDDAPLLSEEGEDTSEQKLYGMSRVFTLSNSEHTFAVQMRDDATGANNHFRSALFGLRLNAFEDHEFDWNEDEFTPASVNIWEELAGLDFTPTTAGDWFIICSGIADSVGDVPFAIRITVAGTPVPAGQSNNWDTRTYDSTDEAPLFHQVKVNLAASLQDVDFDGRWSSVQHPVEDRSVAAFSVELAAATVAEWGPLLAGERNRLILA